MILHGMRIEQAFAMRLYIFLHNSIPKSAESQHLHIRLGSVDDDQLADENEHFYNNSDY